MQGLLLLSRLDESTTRHHQSVKKPQRVAVMLQPQMLQLLYSSLADQDMVRPLGRIDLRDSKLEQVSDGFIIYEAGVGLRKKVKLQDQDKVTTDAWFLAVYTAITEHERLPVSADNNVRHKISTVLTSSIHDEHTGEVEYEISCQLVPRAHPIYKPSITWKVWKTFLEFQTFDDELRVSFGALMSRIMFPRDRKRDSLFSSMRKKSLQGVKNKQLALYVEQVCQIPEISTDSSLYEKVKHFLGFDTFYEIISLSSSGNGKDDQQGTDEGVRFFKPPVSEALGDVSESPLDHVLQSVGQSATEPLKSLSGAHLSDNSSSCRRSSFAALVDEGEEFVDVVPITDSRAAKRLHKKIVQTVRELVSHDDERVREFQDQTKDFGRDKVSAMEYCAFLLGAVGALGCCGLIIEMAKLLPDDLKREELLQARAAIWRRTYRRQRRRSKQFSESVVLQNQKEVLQNIENVQSRMRPKSDSFGVLNWESERVQATEIPVRSPVVTKRASLPIDTKNRSQRDCSVPVLRSAIADSRRHLNRRASFNTMFGETVQTDPINEENPAENESDNDCRSNQFCTLSEKFLSTHKKVSRNGKERDGSFGSKRHNSIFFDDDEGNSTEDEENHVSVRDCNRRSRNRQQSGSGSGSRDNRIVSGRPLSSVDLTGLRSCQNSSLAEKNKKQNDIDEENSHSRICRSRHHTSRMFDEDANSDLAIEEENPVLARLKKQGAVNFMMQLH